jgi:endonuclease YncB( thermonuclease family)
MAGVWAYNAGPHSSASSPDARNATAIAVRPPAELATTGTAPSSDQSASSESAAAPNPGTVSGVPEVIDTSTLRIDGKVVRLFGVEWARGGQAEDLTRYLRGREVVCRPAPAADTHRCQVDGRDLSEAVLFNGGGRVTVSATPDLVAAENHARTERIGIWRK